MICIKQLDRLNYHHIKIDKLQRFTPEMTPCPFKVVIQPYQLFVFHLLLYVNIFSFRKLYLIQTFLSNVGVEGNYSIQVSEVDYLGPLQSKPVEERDYYLLFSVFFLLAFGVIMFSKSSYRHLAWEKIQAVQWRRIFHWCSREKQD